MLYFIRANLYIYIHNPSYRSCKILFISIFGSLQKILQDNRQSRPGKMLEIKKTFIHVNIQRKTCNLKIIPKDPIYSAEK